MIIDSRRALFGAVTVWVACLGALPSPAAAASRATVSTGGVAAPRTRAESRPHPTGGVQAPVRGAAVPSPAPARPLRPPSRGGPTPAPGAPPRGIGRGDIPPSYLSLYQAAGRAAGVDWRVLATIGKNESDHGRSRAPGVTSGINFVHCCAGPMQICIVRSCGDVWQHYGVDANANGKRSVYEPPDAITAAAAILAGLQLQFGHVPDLLLAAYNAGPGNVRRYRGVPPFRETQRYVQAGLRYLVSLR